ncbi:nucleotide-binding alpha-beta plait domain-containing protein [Tanacetum coccineum]
MYRAFKGDFAKDRSFASVLEGSKAPLSSDVDSSPTIVLDEDCLNTKELSCSLLGRVKEFSALSNIKNALSVEGFSDITIQYMGEFWILLDFSSPESKEAFLACQGACSWFSTLRQASSDFVNVGRIMWVEVEGVPFSLWSENSFKKITGKWGELLDVDDLENTCYHSKRLCVVTKAKYNVFENFKITFRACLLVFGLRKFQEGDIDDKLQELEIGEESDTVAETVFEVSEGQNANQSPDPFEIYDLLNKKKNVGSVDQLEESTQDNLRFYNRSKIKEWNSTHSRSSKAALTGLMDVLHELDIEIDKGSGSDVTVAKRLEVVNSIMTLQRDHATESLQKAKVKWSVEGDENSRFFHGLLNKKRRQLSIRGVMKDGVWVDNPSQVKAEFLNHFTNRFSLPSCIVFCMIQLFPITLTYDPNGGSGLDGL